MATFQLLLLGAGVRVVEAAAAAAPTIIGGLVMAGILQRLLGYKGIRRLFGGPGWRGWVQAWFLGMLTPICSLGVLPVLYVLRRAGVPPGAIVVFAITDPMFSPISVLYGMTLSHPSVVLAFTFFAFLLVTGVAALWERISPIAYYPEPEPPAVAVGWRRMAAMLLVGARSMAGPPAAYIAVALGGVAMLAVALPHGCLQFTMRHDDWKSPLLMSFVALPAYVTPTAVMGQMGSMFDHGNSIGAALVLLCAGAGANLGLVAWLWRSYGIKASLGFWAMFFLIVWTMAYAVEKPLYYAGPRGPTDHTHAFDRYTAPFQAETAYPLTQAANKLSKSIGRHEWLSLQLLAGIAAVGVLLRCFDREHSIERWLESAPTIERRGFDVTVPTGVLGGLGLLGMLLFSIYACYLYYPSPGETLQDISMVKATALIEARTGDPEQAERHILFWDELTRKLEAGAILRGIVVSAEMAEFGKEHRQTLDDFRHAVDDADREQIEELYTQLLRNSKRLGDLYRDAPRRSWAELFRSKDDGS